MYPGYTVPVLSEHDATREKLINPPPPAYTERWDTVPKEQILSKIHGIMFDNVISLIISGTIVVLCIYIYFRKLSLARNLMKPWKQSNCMKFCDVKSS